MKLFAAALLLAATTLPAQDWARTKLDASPRHHEYATLTANGKPLKAFISYPEVKTRATAIVMVPEIFGLSDWAKEMADELSASGYVVIAPDVLTGRGPDGGDTASFPGRDATVQAVSALDDATVLADLDAAADYVRKLPASNGTLAVAGFCWGGGKSFLFATHRPDLMAAFVFYGPPPTADAMSHITAPVYGFYAANDARIDSTLPDTITAMKAAGKAFDPVTYDGAGHGFMRAGEDPTDANPANKTARTQAYTRLLSLLGRPHSHPMIPAGKPTGAIKPTAAPAPQCHDPKTMPGM